MICQPSEENLGRAAALLRAGKLVAFPTETVYGLGADATNREAVERIFAVKGRPANNPLIVHLASLEELAGVAELSDARIRQRVERIKRFWPGPLSVVLPRASRVSAAASAGLDSVAVRIPANEIALRLIQQAGVPVAAPSANRSSHVSPTSAAHVEEELGPAVEIILDGGCCRVGLESTVVSFLKEQPVILRPGAVTAAVLAQALGEEVLKTGPAPHARPESPGLLGRHYAPRTRTVIHGAIAISDYPRRVGYVSFHGSGSRECQEFGYEHVLTLSANGDLDQTAQRLFAALREMDRLGLDLIVVDRCREEGLGEAIMDRIRRASWK